MKVCQKLALDSVFIFLILCLVHKGCFAIEFPEKPSNANFFVDKANLIDADATTQINQIASQLLKDEQVAIFVVTIPSLADYDANGYSIEKYARNLFDEWGIGLDEKNYGMLLLISKGNKKARIELGADWDSSYDRDAKQVMDSLIIPAFKRGNFALGITQGVQGMNAMARRLELPKAKAPWWSIPGLIVSGLFLIGLIYNLFRTGRTGWAWALIVFLGIIIFTILRSSRGGSSGGFGGGFSGGGGATGSW